MAYLICGGNETLRDKETHKLYQKTKKDQEMLTDPDTFILTSQEAIGIEEIRNLKHWLALKANTPPKVVIIPQVQTLTLEAQATLGKALEEPPGEAVIIIACPQEEKILPTLISRCLIVNLPKQAEITLDSQKHQEALEALAKIDEMKFGERIQFGEGFKTKEEAQKFCQVQLLLWRERLLANPSQENAWVLRQIQKTLRYLEANVNPKLALENLLLTYPLKE